MIAVDTSALVAIVLGEADAEQFLDALTASPARLSAVSLVEARIVVEARQGLDAARDLQLLLESSVDTIVPVDEIHALAATAAWRRFGKGRHVASLNFGDCFAYALARIDDVPLLYKGQDFAQTDVASVL
jgi:ribonuclease VapC